MLNMHFHNVVTILKAQVPSLVGISNERQFMYSIHRLKVTCIKVFNVA